MDMWTHRAIVGLTKNPLAYVDKGSHLKKIGVWCAVFQKQIVGTIFFKKTVNSNVYCSIISQFIALLEPDECYCTFQQYSAKPHTSSATTEFLKQFFDDWLTSTDLCPPRIPNLTPLISFCEEHWRTTFSKELQKIVDQLKQRITMKIRRITQVTLKKSFQKPSLMRFNL